MSAGRDVARPSGRSDATVDGAEAGGRRAWLAFLGAPPLLVVSPAQQARRGLEPAARRHGYGGLIETDSARVAYGLGQDQRPGAMLCDTRLSDGGDEQLRVAVRSDFLLREVPLIVVPLADLARREADAVRLGEPLFEALDSVLSPRGALLNELARGTPEVTGWVEPIGVANLLRAIGAGGGAGTLTLDPEQGPAVAVTIAGGAVARVEDSGVPADDLELALVDLVGRRWRSFVFAREAPERAARPLRPAVAVEAAVERAQRQNNALVHRIFERGLGQEGLAVDDRALLAWVARQAPDARALAEQVADGVAPSTLDYGSQPALLRTLLHDLRREAVLRVRSAALVAVRGGGGASVAAPAPAVGVRPRPQSPAPRSRARRALVVMAAFFGTLLLGAAGYYLLRR